MRDPAPFKIPPRTAAQKADEKRIHEHYTGRKVTLQELLDDAEYVTTMGEWYEAHKAMVALKRVREERHLTAADVARLIGVTEEEIKKLEAGIVGGPYLDILTRYAHALGKRVFVQLADAT
jgi:DNA-binding XRE family transcriptional regulator